VRGDSASVKPVPDKAVIVAPAGRFAELIAAPFASPVALATDAANEAAVVVSVVLIDANMARFIGPRNANGGCGPTAEMTPAMTALA
jgi:hypothetical protein